MSKSTFIIVLFLIFVNQSFSQNFYNYDIGLFRVNPDTDSDTNFVIGLKHEHSTLNLNTQFNTGNNDIIHISSGDFNGDYIDDIALVSNGGNYPTFYNRILIYLSNGSSFSYETELPIQHLGYDIQGLTCSDFNNDGYDDIAFFRSQGDVNPSLINLVLVYKSNGSSFTQMSQFSHADSSFNNITSGDYNGDGNADIAFSRKYTDGPGTFNDVTVYESNGTSFSELTYLPCHNLGYDILGLTSGDYNNDGLDDIAFFRSNGDNEPTLLNKVLVYKSEGNSFSYMTFFTYGNTSFNKITSGDFNGDGICDIAISRKLTISTHNNITLFESNSSSFSYVYNETLGGYDFLGIAGGRFFGVPNSNFMDKYVINFQNGGTDH